MSKQNKSKILIAFLVILLLLVSGTVGWKISQIQKDSDPSTTTGIMIAENEKDWNQDLEDLSKEEKGIKIPGYGELTVQNGEKNWNITLANPDSNSCYFRYTITVDGEEQPLYQSDLIEPGKAITEFQTTKALKTGDYQIHLNIATYSMDDDLTPLNGADVKSVLHVI